MWIYRDITPQIQENSDAIQIIRGPRQTGKTALILKIDPQFKELSLDDPHLRHLAQNDPELFLGQFNEGEKLFIDEAQYAPELFSSLKRRADLYKRSHQQAPQTIIRLTGSNQILMDKYIKESLAGRASFFDLSTLSISEIQKAIPFTVQEILFRGGWPELYSVSNKNPQKYLDDYISSYIEKDIILTAGIEKSREFMIFLKLLAGRVAQILDYTQLSKSVGVEVNTIRSWISVLEKMQIIALVMPYAHNLSKRLIKSPKIYFRDTGLACRLQGWSDPGPILTSPQQGPLFENLVFTEIYKTKLNMGIDLNIFHWRSRDGEEIDFLVELSNQKFLFIESKVTPQRKIDHTVYPEVKKIFKKKIPKLIQCHQQGEHVLDQNVPISHLKNYLINFS